MATNQAQLDAMEQRRSLVADLMVNGWQALAIARHLGVSHQTVYNDIDAIRAQWAKNQTRQYDTWVQGELETLTYLESKIAHRIDTGDLAAVQTRLRILERRAKYLDLDSPTRYVIDDGLTAEIRELAEQVNMVEAPAVRAILDAHTG